MKLQRERALKWKTLSNVPIPDIVEFVRNEAMMGQSVHVGTDSLQTGRFTQFVTVVAILTPHKGGRVAYTREVVHRIKSLRERLLREVAKSVDLAMQLEPVVKGVLTVAIDANPDLKYRSSAYVQELVGYVVAQGFEVAVKPDAWCATTAADHVVRVRGKLPPHAN